MYIPITKNNQSDSLNQGKPINQENLAFRWQ